LSNIGRERMNDASDAPDQRRNLPVQIGRSSLVVTKGVERSPDGVLHPFFSGENWSHARSRELQQGRQGERAPFRSFPMNAAWLELVLIGCDLVAWVRMLLLSGTDLATCEPKRLRYRLFHVAGRIVRHARGIRLRPHESWP